MEYKTVFKTSIDDGVITIREESVLNEIVQKAIEHQINTKEQVMVDSLVKLGWTPPLKDNLEITEFYIRDNIIVGEIINNDGGIGKFIYNDDVLPTTLEVFNMTHSQVVQVLTKKIGKASYGKGYFTCN